MADNSNRTSQEPEPQSATRTFQFSTKTLLILTALVAGLVALYPLRTHWLAQLVVVVLIMNLFGVALAILITKVFGFPTDGGYRDPEIRDELERERNESPDSTT